MLRSSGSTGSGSWYGLSDGNVLSVLESHVDRMRGADVALSYLPWFHCFGLVLGLLYYIHESMVVIRDPAGGRSVPRLQQLADEHEVDHFNSVPLVIDRLRTVQSQPLYEQLDEGIVGGAPIRPPVADALRGTNMRVGYGQTEASPGIALGDQGDFSTNYLGQPVGCELRENDSGELEFRGPNAYRARFPTGEPPQKREVPRWVPTGDLGQDTGEGFYFQGRRDRSFKLANGQFIRPDVHEQKLVNGLGAIHEAVIIPSGTGGISVAVDSSKSPSQLEESVRDEMRDVEQYIDTVVSLGEVEIKTNNKGEYRRGASSLDQPVDSGMAV